MYKAATWNVNSIGVRKDRLLGFLARETPDVLCLQELKCVDEKFPLAEVEGAGYHAVTYGQKTYNGVAVISKEKPVEVVRGFGDGVEDPAARFLVARFPKISVISAYIPNGQEVGSDKYVYKLAWLQRLKTFCERAFKADEAVLLMGDFNVAPHDLDVHDPKAWHEKILCSTPERQALAAVQGFGFTDTFRHLYPDTQQFTWWDYRMLGFPKNLGLRIDLILATKPLIPGLKAVRVDRDERKGDKPSDHAPVIAEMDLIS